MKREFEFARLVVARARDVSYATSHHLVRTTVRAENQRPRWLDNGGRIPPPFSLRLCRIGNCKISCVATTQSAVEWP